MTKRFAGLSTVVWFALAVWLRVVPGNAADDRFYSRYLVRRLPAEVVLDAYSQLTGVPTNFNQVQDTVDAQLDSLWSLKSTPADVLPKVCAKVAPLLKAGSAAGGG